MMSKAQISIIEQNAGKIPIADIAKLINKTPDAIYKVCKLLGFGLQEKVVSNRQIAKENGDMLYQGLPCTRGHTVRYTINKQCRYCTIERSKRRRSK